MSRPKLEEYEVEVPVTGDFAAACKGARSNKGICPYGCGRVVSQRTIESHRTQGCKGYQEEPIGDGDRRRNFLCGVCCQEFHARRGFMDHLNDEHDVAARTHVLDFPDRLLFERFIHWLEANGGAHFRTKSGARKQMSGRKAMIYQCNRTGFVETISKRKAAASGAGTVEKMGPVRCGYTCTAYITCLEHPDGRITATFCGDHYGHDARMRVPNAIRNLIARMVLESDMGFSEVIRFLHYRFLPLTQSNLIAQRICMIDCDEVKQIVQAARKLVDNGGMLPDREDVWDEELLDKAGIDRPWISPQNRNIQLGEESTDDMAKTEKWPVPAMFVAKQRSADGQFKPVVHMLSGLAVVEENARAAETERAEDHEEHIDVQGEYMKPKRGRPRRRQDSESIDVTSPMPRRGRYETRHSQQREEAPEPLVETATQSGKEDIVVFAAHFDDGILEVDDEQPTSSQQIPLDHEEQVGYENINVEDIDEEWEGRMAAVKAEVQAEGETAAKNGKATEKGSTKRSYLVRSMLTETQLIRTLIQSNACQLSDDMLAAWLVNLRTMRTDFSAMSRTDATAPPITRSQHNFDWQPGEEETSMGRKRRSHAFELDFGKHAPADGSYQPPVGVIKASLFEDQLSDDEELIQHASRGQVNFRRDIWS